MFKNAPAEWIAAGDDGVRTLQQLHHDLFRSFFRHGDDQVVT